MRFDVCYLIRPNQKLLDKLASEDRDMADVFSEPQLWSKPESGKSAWSPREHSLAVKLMFLLHFESVYRGGTAEPLVRNLLGTAPYSESVFDAWWTIERHMVEIEFAESVRSASAQELGKIVASESDAVAEWLQEMRTKRAPSGQ